MGQESGVLSDIAKLSHPMADEDEFVLQGKALIRPPFRSVDEISPSIVGKAFLVLRLVR